MELTEDLYDEIDAFLNNRMMPGQEAAFRQRLEQDAELRNEVAMQQLLNQGLEATALKNRLTTLRKGVQRQRFTQRAVRSAVAIAVIGLLTVGGYYALHEGTATPYEALALAAYQPDTTATRDDNSLSDAMVSIRASYKAGQYEQVMTKLRGLRADSSRLVPYYRGLTLLALKRPNEAITNLTESLQTPDEPTRQKAEWYLALAYLWTNETAKARFQLEAIAANTDHPYADQAAELLKQLR